MTEHSKIPVPSPDKDAKPGEAGKVDAASLLERAQDSFSLGSFKPAPVPDDVRNAPMPKKRVESAPEIEPAKAAPVAEQKPAVPESFEAPPEAPAPQPEPIVVEKSVEFPTEIHPVDKEQLRDLGMIVPDGAVSGLLEEFRIVKRQLLLSAKDAALRDNDVGKSRRVLICSPHPDEGKTFCATNLALAIAAERDSEVVLVDADVAKPSILSVLGLEGGLGLMDAISDPSVMVEDCVLRTDIPGLFVLPAGSQTDADSEYIASSRTTRVLDRLTRGATNRIVIFDSPPALAASPAAELAKHVGQALLVARADRTGQSALEDAVQLLSTCPDIKLLLNAANFSPSGRRFGSYYGYGG